jgi:hypothetical protein
VSESNDSRLFERKGRLSRLKEGRLRLPFTENERINFQNLLKHFWSNENHFPVEHYFRPYQTPKNIEIIF